MSVISKRASARRTALMDELRGKFPALLQRPASPGPADRTAIALGRNPAGVPVLVPQQAFLEHCHALGTTGSGKTSAIAHASRQTIANGCGALIIDPHGEHPGSLYRSQLAWLAQRGYLERRTVHLIDPNAPTHTVGFNPLARPDCDTDLSVVAGVTLEAFSRAWGGEDMAQKPTIERVLTATFSALADMNLTLVEAPMLLDRSDRHGLRARALESVSDRYTRDELRRLHDLSLDERRRHDFDLEVVGPINRLARFVRPPAIRAMIGQTGQTLDLRTAMDEGHVVLCNLSGGARVYEADADLLGRLLTRALFFHAKRRRHPERPFYVYLDECHRYLSGDLENILAEARKYGVAALLAHQWLEQLRAEGDNMLAAVQSATNVKLVFRIKDAKEAEELAASVVPLDLEMPVRTLVKPTVVGHRRIRLANEGASEQSATTHASAETRGQSEAYTVSYSQSAGTTDSTGESLSESETVSAMQGQSHVEGSGETEGSVATEMLQSTNGFFGAPAVVGMAQAQSVATSMSRSNSSSSQAGRSRASGRTTSRTHAESQSESWGESMSYGKSRSSSVGNSVTQGTGTSHGSAEALEPILAHLPSAVHGKQAVLHMAAETLRNLATGQAFINYVGATGMVAALLNVARVAEHRLSETAFAALRERVLARSSAAVPMAAALAAIAGREQTGLAAVGGRPDAAEPDRPSEFRVRKLRPANAARGQGRRGGGVQ